MSQSLSDKKNCQIGYVDDNKRVNLLSFVKNYGNFFGIHRRNNFEIAYSYLLGLMRCEKNHTNMERMVKQVPEQAYHQYHNFLSESVWDYNEVNKQTALEASALMENSKAKSNKPTGLIVDESSHLKKDSSSVGVARQYASVSGKIDNCQVAVYYLLCNEENATLDELIFLEEPGISIPLRQGPRGAIPFKRKVDAPALRIDEYYKALTENQWIKVEIRKTAKGMKFVLAHTAAIWHWDDKEEKARRRTLVITK